MSLSVVIPVFNAQSFVEQSVLSALSQEETSEVILIEDGSTDDSLTICQKLARENNHVSLATHPGRINKGAGASRNLGLRLAKGNYVAFLDADDYFLPSRFAAAIEKLNEQSNIDGVYGMAKYKFLNSDCRRKYIQIYGEDEVVGLKRKIGSSNLLKTLMGGGLGFFSIVTLVVRREVFDHIGLFDKNLKLHQDTDFIWRLAMNKHIESDEDKLPRTIINIHEQNRVFDRSLARVYRHNLTAKWLKIASENNYPYLTNYIVRNYLDTHPKTLDQNSTRSRIKKIPIFIHIILKYPKFLWAIIRRNASHSNH